MTWMKALGAALILALALYGGAQIASSARNLYGDWVFLRALRVQAIQQQQRANQQLPPQPAPAPVAPPQ